MKLSPNDILIRRQHKGHGKPPLIVVLDQDCEKETFIRLRKEDGNTMVMNKCSIPKFYRHLEEGEQLLLFKKESKRIDRLREKHLK